jgi:CHASE2 domain-containing sensor protein
MEIIQAVAKQHPKAIGVDIDFGPNPDGWKDDNDPRFFDFCLSMKQETGVPIFLAVYTTQAQPAVAWLGLERYKELAAAGVIDANDAKRLPRWIQAKGVRDRLTTMSAALANSYAESLPGPYEWLRKTVEVTTDNQHGIERVGEDQMRFGFSLVNYTKLDEIQARTQDKISATSIEESVEKFTGKIVLLGDATSFEGRDAFIVPGRSQPVAGVYLIACATYSLAVEPLFEFNKRTRLGLDLLIALVLFVLMEGARRRYVKIRPDTRFFRASNAILVAVTFLVILFGIFMVAWCHIMWFDIPAVITASRLHPRVEQILVRFGKKLVPFRHQSR